MSTDKMKELDSFLAEIFREGPSIPTNVPFLPSDHSDRTRDDAPAGYTPSSDAPAGETNTPSAEEIATTTVEQAKSVLAGLNRDTAIRLRWAMRDIKARRTKLSPLNPNDLAALIDLGFVEMRDGTPVLTNVGFLALD
jgi:hypothetical protein